MFAIVKTGGKQYKVKKDEELVVESLKGEVGDAVELPVSFVADGADFDFEGRTARAEIVEHVRGKKLHIYKYRPKKNSRKKTGHRQDLTRIKITEV